MVGWLILLQKDKVIYKYSVFITIFLIFLILFSPYYQGNVGTIIQVLISIFVSILSAVLILYFSNYQKIIVKINNTFLEVYEEIVENYQRLNEKFEEDCKVLENEWIKGIEKIGGGDGKWLPKREAEYGRKNIILSRYHWRYLLIKPYKILNDEATLDEIEDLGFDIENIIPFWNYSKRCHFFCDNIQELESLGNIQSYYIGLCKIVQLEELDVPKIILKDNQYNFTPDFKKVNIRECKEEISQIIREMIKIKTEFLIEFEEYYKTTKDCNKEDFLKKLLKLTKLDSNSIFNKIVTSNDTYYSLFVATIFVFILFSLIEMKNKIFCGVVCYLINYWVYIVIWIALFVTYFVLKKSRNSFQKSSK